MSFIDWKDVFDDIFEAYSDKWTLNCVHRNITSKNQNLQNKRTMMKTGYARFHCLKCSNNWASAKAMVIFYFPNSNQRLGKVTLRFLGQQCKTCSRTNHHFVDPEFDDDAIKTTINKLYEKIGWLCYGRTRPATNKNTDPHTNKITGPHEKSLCEACRIGCCEKNT